MNARTRQKKDCVRLHREKKRASAAVAVGAAVAAIAVVAAVAAAAVVAAVAAAATEE